jgi:phenylacetate-coenzyme A ligase PaaK-like adenylate-forming protein
MGTNGERGDLEVYLINIWKKCVKREFYTHEQWENFQTYNLRKILEHAFRNVPLYREKYSSAGFNESDFKTLV